MPPRGSRPGPGSPARAEVDLCAAGREVVLVEVARRERLVRDVAVGVGERELHRLGLQVHPVGVAERAEVEVAGDPHRLQCRRALAVRRQLAARSRRRSRSAAARPSRAACRRDRTPRARSPRRSRPPPVRGRSRPGRRRRCRRSVRGELRVAPRWCRPPAPAGTRARPRRTRRGRRGAVPHVGDHGRQAKPFSAASTASARHRSSPRCRVARAAPASRRRRPGRSRSAAP